MISYERFIQNRSQILLIAAFAIIFIAEFWMLGQSPDPIFAAGGRQTLFSLAFLAWWALTVVLFSQWILRFAVRLVQQAKSVRRIGGLIVLVIAAASFVVAYAVSWGLYLQSGRFANWEVMRFAVANAGGMWIYLLEAEPIHLIRMGIVTVLACFVMPVFVHRISRRIPVAAPVPIFRQRIWIWPTIVMCLATNFLIRDPSPRRRFARLGQIKCSLNPLVSLGTSIGEAMASESIEPNLRPEILQPTSAPWSPGDNQAKQRPVVVIAIESLRSDVVHARHQGQEITPNINRLAKAGVHWTNAYSQSTHSDYADICIVSSLYPLRTRTHHYYSKSDPWPKTLIYDLLKPAGYETAIISSQNEAWGRMESFLDSPNLDFFYHPERSPNRHLEMRAERDVGFHLELETGALQAGKFPDRHTADVAIDWIKKQTAAQKPFFLSMNLQSSHFPFLMPDDVERPFQPCEFGSDIRFMIFPESKTDIVKNAYFNALHEADQQVGRLVSALEDEGILDDVILLVIGENGEAFHENGSCGHGREPVEPVIHVATVVHAPNLLEPRVDDYPLEHVDLMPTVLGLLGWPPHPNFQGIDVLSESRPQLSERLLYFHVLSPSARADAVQWAGRWKYQINHATQETALFDIRNDPQESKNLIDEHPEIANQLFRLLTQWRDRQLAYYHFPDYYLNYFPPPSPRLRGETLEFLTQHVDAAESES